MKQKPSAPRGDATALAQFIPEFVESHLAVFDNNNLGFNSHVKAWDGFLLGFSSGADELYPFLQRHIGEFHWTPAEAFALGRTVDLAPNPLEPPDLSPVSAGELTVVSCALLQTAETKSANRRQMRWPSEPWARARIYGHRCVRGLQRALVTALQAGGYEAVAPTLLPAFAENESRQYAHASTWSERHVAYISGLGTFSLSGGLITERGQAHRLASVIVRAKLQPTKRSYDDPFAYCLYYTTGGCAKCAARCPAGSIDPGGRDKRACARHLMPGTAEHVKQHYGFDGYGCGLCQTGVPCESRIPPRERALHTE